MASATAPQDTSELQSKLHRMTLHYNAGRHQAALDLADDIDTEHGELAETMHLRGLSMYALGQSDEGIALIEEASQFLPDNGGIVADLGALLAQAGKYEAALPYFTRATELAPHYAGGWSNLGAVHFMMENYADAIAPLSKAVELDPNLLDAQSNLGTALAHQGRHKSAVDAFYRALAIDPNDPGTHIGLSSALYRLERHDTALYHAQKALELRPNLLIAHLHIGNAMASLGKMEEAEDHLLKAAARMPGGIAALSRLIHIRKTKPDSPEFERLQRLVGALDKLPDTPRTRVHFAAGKAYADLGDYETSFAHLKAANDLTAKEHQFDLQNHTEQANRIMEVVTPSLIAELRASSGISDVAPIFICGMPRSGTTLMELMLSRHSDVQAGGELRASNLAIGQVRGLVSYLEEKSDAPLVADDFTQVGEFYMDALRKEGLNSTIVTDKMPINYMYIGLLALALPRAKFLIMRRHPMDCCLSNWTQDFGRNQPFSTDFVSLGAVYNTYRRMTDYWSELLPDVTRIVPYEDLTAAPEDVVRDVLGFCCLDWQDDVLDPAASSRPVNTASIGQVRQPIYRSSVQKWRAYGALLRPLAEQFADQLDEEDLRAAGVDMPTR